jgi:hypothetical protein
MLSGFSGCGGFHTETGLELTQKRAIRAILIVFVNFQILAGKGRFAQSPGLASRSRSHYQEPEQPVG